MSFSYLSAIRIDKEKPQPVYLQLAFELSSLIKQGVLKPGQKLPGSRVIATVLSLNRNTVNIALEELQAQGWIEVKSRSGMYVNHSLPEVKLQHSDSAANDFSRLAGFELKVNDRLFPPPYNEFRLQFNDGEPDPRLGPLDELGREYHRLLKKSGYRNLFSYQNAQGDVELRKVIAQQLNEFRGFNISADNVFVTKGSIMAIYLISKVAITHGDKVVVTHLNYRTFNLSLENAGAVLVRVPVDEKGLNTVELEKLLKKEKIRMLYITSHHHHPTTVCLAPERRLHLYELARQYNFIILEDDYDFDYHYQNKPTLPIASMDNQGLVVYVGSYSKIIYPGIRMGFIIAPVNVINEISKYRRIIDRQGDHVMERALANLIREGTIQRYLRKSIRVYKKRKEHFCAILRNDFSDYLDFQEPEGGMAVWVQFKEPFNLKEISRRCHQKNLNISDGTVYDPPEAKINSCRMGFAHMNENEITEACNILKEVLKSMASEL